MSHSRRVVYMTALLLGAVLVLIYRGPFWPFIRGHVGDWLVVQLMYLIARVWISDRWRFHVAGGVLLSGVLVEAIKYFTAGLIPRTFFAEMTIGSTFDPLDIIAFALGLATVLIVEHKLSQGQRTITGPTIESSG